MAQKQPEKLSAQQRSKIRRLSEPRELAPDEEGGELNIVPFLDIVMNVLISGASMASRPTSHSATSASSGRPESGSRPVQLGIAVSMKPASAAAA